MSKKLKAKTEKINAMSDEELRREMTDMITADVMHFVEIVTRRRVGLFVDSIYEGIKK